MSSSMNFCRQLRAPMVALWVVVLIGAVIMPPEAKATAASIYCQPLSAALSNDLSAPEHTPLSCGICVFAALPTLSAPPDEPLARAPNVVANAVAPARGVHAVLVRNRGPPPRA
ncbi:MAG: hypothetical protein AAF580_01455 [Pseudomonadota bacterium]